MDLSRTPPLEGGGASAEAHVPLLMLRWKTGVELPPFITSNAEVINLLQGLLDGSAELSHAVAISQAVAVQFYRRRW